jgi:hypothetical protein
MSQGDTPISKILWDLEGRSLKINNKSGLRPTDECRWKANFIDQMVVGAGI